MDLSTIFFTLLYGGAIVFIILYLFRSQQPPVVIYPVATSIDYPETSWWPWSVSSYNYWPYWSSWAVGGGDGGYGYRRVYPRSHYRHDRPWGGMNRSANRTANHSTGTRSGGTRSGGGSRR